ncbi:MAG: molybdopterin-dependent oxidoreductase [Deltaproteobacteria bacterium]|nr:molybdopterin-dependent oxidoreductase [Deltaproteobacteria bacterium]
MATTKEVLTDCTLCYHSCGVRVYVEDGVAKKVEGLESHPLNRGKLCPKGEAMLDTIYHPERILYPMKRVGNKWERISWDQALREISQKLLEIKEKYGPRALGVFSGSVGVENYEIAGLTQRFAFTFGSPNFFSVESICYRMRIRARQITFGKYPTEELDSNLYILWGHNPHASDFPLYLSITENLKKGAKIVVIDPRRIPFADQAHMYIPIRPGTDGALALALINVIINEDLYDKEFVEKYTFGFEKLKEHIKSYTPQWAEKITGVKSEDIIKLARLFAKTKGAGIYQGTNTQDQTASGTHNSRAFAILQTITGNINVPGGWVISPRLRLGNVGSTIDDKPLGADEYPLFYEVWGRKSPYGVITLVPESIPEKIKAFLIIAGNPVVSMPDSNAFKEAFSKLELLVVLDMFMTETAELAHYFLPASSHLEKWGLAYSYNVCHCLPYLMLRKKAIEPLGESVSEWKFFKELSKRLGMEKDFPWQSEEELVDFEVRPSGFDFNYLLNVKPEGDFYQKKEYGIKEGEFATPTKKIEIYSTAMEQAGHDPLPVYIEPHISPVSTPELLKKYPLILTTGIRDLYFTHGQFRNVKKLREKSPEPKAEIGIETAKKYGIEDGDDIIIETPRGQIKVKAQVTDRVMEGVVCVPHGWPKEANVNLLTDTKVREPIMGYPELKSLLCAIRKA